eukprot:757418-Prymnesium_polylepis.1
MQRGGRQARPEDWRRAVASHVAFEGELHHRRVCDDERGNPGPHAGLCVDARIAGHGPHTRDRRGRRQHP